MVVKEAVEQEMERAGWEVDDGFSSHLLIGNAGDLSILMSCATLRVTAAEYEIYDARRDTVCRVGVIPTPLRAGMLLEEHGESAFSREEGRAVYTG